MKPMEYSVLKRAEEQAIRVEDIRNYIVNKAIDIDDFKNNPDKYERFIREYSEACIHYSLYEETKDRLDKQYTLLCEFHRHYEEQLTKQFYDKAKHILLSAIQ